MRYELMTDDQKEKMLERLHKKFNKLFYNNELTLPHFIIADYATSKESPGEEAWAGYLINCDIISFSRAIDRDFSMCRTTIKQETIFLARIMLHEMAHQYCSMNGIDDSNHNENWHNVAKSHGLKFEEIYEEEMEMPSLTAIIAVRNFRLK